MLARMPVARMEEDTKAEKIAGGKSDLSSVLC